jgi:dTDP-4-amino-4,6-dideoxygalactose transaminase
MLNVPFVEFSKIPTSVKNNWRVAASTVIDAGYFVGGRYVAEFEEEWAKRVGVDFAVGVGNGLDGLVMALKAIGAGQGDFVAVPSHTFIATWSAVHLAGATPVGIDVDQYGLMNLEELEALPLKLKAVIPVHMHGMMVDMSRLGIWARKHSVSIIEDASQAHLAVHDEKFAGNWSDIGVFSLYPSKNLGALGDAGIVTTNSPEHADAIRKYANYGASIQDKYLHETFGVNSRLDSMQAAFLSVNLQYLTEWNERRKTLADIYLKNLETNKMLMPMNAGQIPSVWHHFPVLTKMRSEIQEQLRISGIQTEIHYPNLAAFEYQTISNSPKLSYPEGENIASKILSLPISPWHSDDQILYVCKELNRITKKMSL